MSSGAPPAASAALMNAPAGSLILRSTSTADDAGTTGAHSPGTPTSGAATPHGGSLLSGGYAAEGRVRGARPRHQSNTQLQEQGVPGAAPPSVHIPHAAEMGAAGSAWGTPVEVRHQRQRSFVSIQPHKGARLYSAASEPAHVTLDSPAVTVGAAAIPYNISNGSASGPTGEPHRVSNGAGSVEGPAGAPHRVLDGQGSEEGPAGMHHRVSSSEANVVGPSGIPYRLSNGEGQSADATSAQSVPSTPGLPSVPNRAGSPELDMGIMPPASPLVRGQRDSLRHRSKEEQEISWRSQPAELGGVPAVPATGKTVGTDGGM